MTFRNWIRKLGLALVAGAMAYLPVPLAAEVETATTTTTTKITTEEVEASFLPAAKEFLEKVEIHAFTEAGYIFNATSDEGNGLRVFDQHDNDFSAEAELVLLKPLVKEWDAGFRFDLRAGSDIPELITAAGSGSPDEIDIEQAMVTLRAPVCEQPLDISIGKFVTHVGWEYIQGWDSLNDNISRSILFGYAIPFTHTGIKAMYTINEDLCFTLLGFNGWDNFDDNNDAKSIGQQIVWKVDDKLTIYANGIQGAEQTDEDHDWRFLANLIVEYAHDDNWTFVLDGVYGFEQDVDFTTTVPAIFATTVGGVTALDAGTVDFVTEKDANWGGLAGYVRFQVNDWLAWIGRAEFFIDDDGARTGTEQEVWEITNTLEAKLCDNARLQLEGRYDNSDEDVFDDGDDDDQFTVAVNAQFWI